MAEKIIKYEELVDVVRRMHRRDELFYFFLRACESGNLTICQACLDAGADINIKDAYYGRPILLEFSNSEYFSTKVADWLIDNGADINATGAVKDNTNLTQACYHGNMVVAKYFIEKGIKINYMTALHDAIDGKHCKVAEMLLELGAMSKITKNESEELLMNAVKCGCPDIVKLFLKKGVSPNFYIHDEAPIHVAVERGTLEIVKILLDNNADVNAQLKSSARFLSLHNHKFALTPIDIAVVLRKTKMKKLLEDFGGKASSKEEKLNALAKCDESESEYVLREIKRLNAE